MSQNRIFNSRQFCQLSDGEPIRSVITETPDATIVVWYLKPGQRIKAHRHPHGQDTWTILTGEGEYQLDLEGSRRKITAGDVVIAHTKEVHGVHNKGETPLIFISVVAPAEAGYELLENEYA